MTAVVRAVLAGLIDYAGLFPPAGLPMGQAVANFGAYRRGADAWALARFVVPVRRLDEFEACRPGQGWEVSALLGPDPVQDMKQVESFNQRHAGTGPSIRSLETAVSSAEHIAAVRRAVPAPYELYLELPPGQDLDALAEAVSSTGARAKVRVGGVRPEDIPDPGAVLAFLQACAERRLPFKATAGLHHPVRQFRALTYEADSPRATMFGYLNVLLAAAALWEGRSRTEALRLLTLEDAASLRLEQDGLRWEGTVVSAATIARTRREFALAIGSCSFTEPVEEIGELAEQGSSGAAEQERRGAEEPHGAPGTL